MAPGSTGRARLHKLWGEERDHDVIHVRPENRDRARLHKLWGGERESMKSLSRHPHTEKRESKYRNTD